MAKVIFCVILCALLSSKLISTAEVQRHLDENQNRKRPTSDPVSDFFSELGDLFLDFDQAISVQTAPKVRYEDTLANEILGPLQPRKEYFDRIQENYKNFQNRLGSLIEERLAQQGQLDPLQSILLPLRNRDVKENLPKVESHNSHSRNVVGRSSQIHEQSINSEDQIRKAMEKLISDTRRNNEFLGSLGSKALDEVSSVFVRRSGDISDPADDSVPQERIIGDSLYSESRFDNYIRQLLRNHGTWVLDNPLLQRWRGSRRASRNNAAEVTSTETLHETTEEYTTPSIADGTTEALTETYEPSTIESNEQLESEKLSKGVPLMAANYYRVGDDGRVVEEEVDIILQPDSNTGEGDQVEAEEIYVEDGTEGQIEMDDEPRDTVILAFTPDGVPLKLRMGPEIENPVKYLHKVLRTAGVSLKVPVESYEDLEPVGKEVLLLGSGIITRAVYLDLSNPNELKALLRTLMKTKVSEQRKY